MMCYIFLIGKLINIQKYLKIIFSKTRFGSVRVFSFMLFVTAAWQVKKKKYVEVSKTPCL